MGIRTAVATKLDSDNPRVVIGDNRPPLDEAVVIDFNEAIDSQTGLRTKIAALVARAATAGPVTDAELAGKYADFIKMTGTCESMVDAERVRIKAPILAAQRALDGAAKAIADDLAMAKGKVKRHLDTFIAAENARVQAERRAAERARQEAERAAREAAERERAALQRVADEQAERERQRRQAIEDERAAAEQREAAAVVVEAQVIEVEPEAFVAPVPVIEAPVFRGDLGSRVGVKETWDAEVLNMRHLPDFVLKHPEVVAAATKVVKALVRAKGGVREMKGARIWAEQTSSVR